jgi:hypothetical protein
MLSGTLLIAGCAPTSPTADRAASAAPGTTGATSTPQAATPPGASSSPRSTTSPTDAATTSPTPAPSASARSTASPRPTATADAAIVSDAEKSLDTFVAATAGAAAAPEDPNTVDRIADGALLADIEAQLAELESNGWTSTGVARIGKLRVLSSDTVGTRTTLTVETCVDSSDVVVLDATGDPLPSTPSSARALTTFTVLVDGDHTVVTDRRFPDNPRC